MPEGVKQRRLDRLMLLQEGISAELSQAKVGQTYRVVIDRREGDYFIGRTEHDSPEVDCEVLVSAEASPSLQPGSFYDVRVTAAEEFDLYGEIVP